MQAGAANEDRDHLPFEQHHAFIIGINAYEKVSPLNTAVEDARQLAKVLGAQQHFRVHPPLLDAKGSEIRALLQTTLPEQVGKGDRVVFYFAGHGIAADGDDGPAGYIVPADADPGDLKTFIPMADLQKALDALPCRHLLLILDCCFSGAFKWSSQYRAISDFMPKKIYKERFDRFIEDPAWQVITSAAYDQKALDVVRDIGKATGDRGVAKSEDNSAHSPFAKALFEGLRGAADAKGDIEGDGVITATELYSYIRDQIEPQTIEAGQRLRQTPGFFPLRKHDKGEFIFLHPRHRLNLAPLPKRSPYKGLESFNESDQLLFFGRDRVIEALRARAQTSKLLVVSGASGTGKSSVVKAGLLPALRATGLRILPVIRPGAHPLAVLEQALDEARAVSTGPDAAAPAVAQPAILLIDQYEELITRCSDRNERAQFDARLRRLLDEDSALHRIIVTVRADFEPQLNDGELKDYWREGRCTVPPFSLEELKQIIVMPTIQEVLIFDPPQLVDEIIAEVVQAPGALPLLSYSLSELYEAYRKSGRQDRALKKEDYDRIGGVMGALRTKADALHRQFDAPKKNTMRKILLRMVSVEGDLAGKRVPMDDLVFSDTEAPLVTAVVEGLVDARLVAKGQDYIEPAHDALVRAWMTLHEWIHEAGKEKLILGAKLNAAATEFAQSRNVEFLWNNNPHLLLAERELKTPQHGFNAKEAGFIRASVRRKTIRARIWRSVTAMVFATVTGLMVWGWVEQRRSTGTIAEARGFTDELLVNIMKKLRSIDKTHDVRKDLVTQVRRLHGRLVLVGAKEDHNTRFWTSVLEGDVELDRRQHDAARRKYEEAIRIAEPLQADPYWQRNLSIGHGQLADLALKADEGKATDFAAARSAYLQALEIDKRLANDARLVPLDEGNKVALHDLFVSYFRLGDLERRQAQGKAADQAEEFVRQRQLEARKMYEQALAIAERLTKEHADDPEAKRELTKTLLELGNVSFDLATTAEDEDGLRAHREFSEALRWAQRWREEVLHHPSMQGLLGAGYGRLAYLQSQTRDLGPAREFINKALEIAQRPAGPAGKDTTTKDDEQQLERLVSYKTLGDIEAKDRRFDAARRAYQEALRIAEREAGIHRQDERWQDQSFSLLIELGNLEINARNRAAARAAFQRAMKATASKDQRQFASRCLAALRCPNEP